MPLRLCARKPVDPAYPKELRTLGDHLRRRRLELGLLQREVAIRLGVSEASVWNWENGRTAVHTRLVPRVYDFLGYTPWNLPDGFGTWLREVRRGLGLSRRKMARMLGADESTVAGWEHRCRQPSDGPVAKIRALLERLWTQSL